VLVSRNSSTQQSSARFKLSGGPVCGPRSINDGRAYIGNPSPWEGQFFLPERSVPV